ncbi:hypothetical protein DPMN_156810 [Dreissena polymorpha]|uniref:Uncharacterized protein n=1 Tax=Dreissena polymorpha TaxID=45954 RepID=A0A9D4FPM4_DREPO|nr:hypothetical protein DPMN_156810 [Dreissena polymorpha]
MKPQPMKNGPPPGGHHNIIVLTKFYEDLTINMTSRVLTRKKTPYAGGHNKINVLTKFHGDWTETKTTDFKNKAYIENYHTHPGSHENASYKHIEKTAPSPGGNVFPLITTIFKLIRPINKTNVLTTFHDDWPKNVTFRVKMTPPPPPGGHVTRWIKTIFELNRRIQETRVVNVVL